MEWICNEYFNHETIRFDGFIFKNCSFHKCVILISTLNCHFIDCTFYESMFYVDRELSAADLTKRFLKSVFDKTTQVVRNDCQYPRTILQLPATTVRV